ncbi:MAG: hypothetical protein HW390_2705 [Candidatus Brocadiaceae bacterium]|nr:hypothetical protein [Candidatus Brocadiaceae bacterium]
MLESITFKKVMSRYACCYYLPINKWWAEPESNRRHQDFQSCALPSELSAQLCLAIRYCGKFTFHIIEVG